MKVTDLTRGIYRRVYSSFLTGRRINAVSLEAEAWYWRLQAVADDFGNCPADPVVLAAAAAPLRPGLDAGRLTDELALAGLVERYECGPDRYLHLSMFPTFQPAGRNGKRVQRYPLPSGGIQNGPGNPEQSRTVQNKRARPAPPIPTPIPISL